MEASAQARGTGGGGRGVIGRLRAGRPLAALGEGTPAGLARGAAQGARKGTGLVKVGGAVGLRRDANHKILADHLALEAVVGVAIRITTGSWAEIEAGAAGPGDADGQLAWPLTGAVLVRARVDGGDHHGVEAREGHDLH